MSTVAYFWFYLVVICFSQIQADFTDVDELVTASEELIAGTYVPPTNNNDYFGNMTSSEAIGEIIKLRKWHKIYWMICFRVWNVRFYNSWWWNSRLNFGKPAYRSKLYCFGNRCW